MAAKPTTPTQLQAVVDSYDTFMFDCDGVLWHGDHLIPGTIEVLAYLRSQKKNIIFVTNNATKSRRNYKGKFDKLGVQAEVDEIFGSAYAAAVYLSSVVKLPKDKKVYVIGMKGLEEELAEEGISYLGGTDPADNTLDSFNLPFDPDPAVAAVFGKNGGLDTLLVLSGVTHKSDISGPNASPIVPDYVVDSLGDFAVLAKQG
ncbi:hypothetical protein FRC08_008296 [Ceratobasidium sp. 394]|nr:hypothetical protein FRC08_008296 [Ceratobasidium sp. 394]